MLGDLIPVAERQASLLDTYDREKVAGLMHALDTVNRSYGPGTCVTALKGSGAPTGKCARIICRLIIAGA